MNEKDFSDFSREDIVAEVINKKKSKEMRMKEL